MVFSSIEFIFIFLPVFLLVYWLAVKAKQIVLPYFGCIDLGNLTIFAGSIIFYSFGVLKHYLYALLFVLTIIVNYLISRCIEDVRLHFTRSRRFYQSAKFYLILGVLFNAFWLILFKYTGFFLRAAFGIIHQTPPALDLILPIGISFYTFQNISYLADVYWRRTKPAPNLINYGAYISMFPQLIAGPIVTFDKVERELVHRTHTPQKIDEGLRFFTAGLGFKVLIANMLSGLWEEVEEAGFSNISSPLAWLSIFGFSFQLYFDFYGYSLMSIGLGKIMGFDLPQNFDQPYQSATMTEFWRRWHMTLGSWFREYIYIPLGGNRHGTGKTIRNLFIVWLLTGIWHGADWNFVIWGLFLFVVMFIERLWTGKFLQAHRPVGRLIMLLLIPVSWAIFAITDMRDLGQFFLRLFAFLPQEPGHIAKNDFTDALGVYWKYFAAAIFFCTPLPACLAKRFGKAKKFSVELVQTIGYLGVFWASVYCLYKGLNDPFLYFRF